MKLLISIVVIFGLFIGINNFYQDKQEEKRLAEIRVMINNTDRASHNFFKQPSLELLNIYLSKIEELRKKDVSVVHVYENIVPANKLLLSSINFRTEFLQHPDLESTRLARLKIDRVKKTAKKLKWTTRELKETIDGLDVSINHYETLYAIHELWESIDKLEKLKPKRIDEINSILQRYKGSAIVNSKIGMTRDPMPTVINVYPNLSKELKRIYNL